MLYKGAVRHLWITLLLLLQVSPEGRASLDEMVQVEIGGKEAILALQVGFEAVFFCAGPMQSPCKLSHVFFRFYCFCCNGGNVWAVCGPHSDCCMRTLMYWMECCFSLSCALSHRVSSMWAPCKLLHALPHALKCFCLNA